MGDLSISKVFLNGLVDNIAQAGSAARAEKMNIDMVGKPAEGDGIPSEYNVPMTKAVPNKMPLPATDRDIPYEFDDMGLGHGKLSCTYQKNYPGYENGYTVCLTNADGSFKRTIQCNPEGNCKRFFDTLESSEVFRQGATRDKEILTMQYDAQGNLESLDVILINPYSKICEHYNALDGFKEPSGHIFDSQGRVIYTYPKQEGLRL